MEISKNKDLYTALKDIGIINQKELDEAFKSASDQHIRLDKLLLDKDLITENNLGKVIADILGLPFITLRDIPIPKEALHLIPSLVAKSQRIIAFKQDEQGVHLAMAEPDNLEVRELIGKKVGQPLIVYYATENDIGDALYLYSDNIINAFEQIISQGVKEATNAQKADPPIIKIVDTIIEYAYQNKASDVHIEQRKDGSLVRFRIDGVLNDIIHFVPDLSQRLVTRIKVMAKLRTDEHQSAQDGKIEYPIDNETLDIRVSVVPAIRGEKIVCRLLSAKSSRFSLEDLGLTKRDLDQVKSAYKKTYGMLLSTGPTGSGKTTTMYTVLQLLNNRKINISTIEDPVEYDIDGVTQIQVDAKTNLTFAKGLRSILRQDPDIILVGEIRDEETADIAVNSAMTGHLVLSTLHTNDAATAIPRLLDMGIEPFLIASTVNVIVAQRLVRKIHSKCRYSEEMSTDSLIKQIGKPLTKKVFGDAKNIRTYKGKGCEIDHQTGYEGRIGIYEVLVIDEHIRKAIMERKDADTIRELAIKAGMTTMIEDGLRKVKEGITTIEEVLRVVR